MPGPIGTNDACSPSSPVGCRWAALAKHEANEADLIDLSPSEQVSRGKELLSMLWSEDAPFPTGDNSLSMSAMKSIDNSILPPMPSMPPMPPSASDLPPPPPGFEVGLSAGFHVEPSPSSSTRGLGPLSHRGTSASTNGQGQMSQQRDWAPPPTGPSQPPVQQQPHHHYQATRSSAQAPAPVWGNMGGGGNMSGSLLGAGVQPGGTWSPLSTNPNTMPVSNASWLSTGVSDRDGSAVAVSSVASSGSNAHIAYSMPPSPNADNGLWSAPPAGPSSNSNSINSMGAMAANMMPTMMMHAQKPLPNQLRAEAAPYVPMNMGVGVPAC